MGELFFLGSFPPPYGGVAIFNSLLYENFSYHSVRFKTLKVGEEGEDGFSLELKKYIKTVKSIEVHSVILDSANIFLEYPTDRVSFYRGYIWCFFKRMRGIRWIKILHDGTLPDRYQKFSAFQQKFVRTMVNVIDCIVVVNPSLEKWLREIIGYRKRIEIIGSLLPMKEQKQVELSCDIQQFMERYDKILLTIGTCDESYGFQQIIQAFKGVKSQTRGMKLGLIAVDGNFSSNGIEYEEKRKKIRQEKDVLLVSKGMPHEMVMELMRECDVFIRGFSSESYGISRAEAIICGTPVIATNVGKIEGMRIYEYGNIEMLTECILAEVEGKEVRDLSTWKRYYEKEAETNYEILINILKEG